MDKNFLFRRQFILSSNPEHSFENWIKMNLDKDVYLSVHPDLEVVQSTNGEVQLTLLGFAVNPFEPNKNNQQILDDMLVKTVSFDEVIKNSELLGGRWIIIYKYKSSLLLFNDPCANRQVYYHKELGNDVLCGSDPAILNHFVKLEKDNSPEIVAVLNNPGFKLNEKAWVGSSTIFKGVKHLMPNHFLDVRAKFVTRFWPYKPIEKMDFHNVVDVCSDIMRGSLLAISKRGKLSLAVTAGWDSRVLLAASKDICNDVTYFVSVKGTENKNYHEVVVPQKIFKELDLPFYIQNCNQDIEPDFKKMMETNVVNSRTYLPKTKFIYKYFLDFEGMINVNGNVSEIARLCIRPIIPTQMTGESLIKLSYYNYGGNYFASQFNIWIDEIKDYCQKYNLNIYDMLYWEQRMGNWGAIYPSELDIAIDQFSPFNNRLLLTTMLSIPEKYRKYPNYKLYYKVIEKLWPETLKQPVGVQPFKSHIKMVVKHLISDALYAIPFLKK
jgi:hypothetical protein